MSREKIAETNLKKYDGLGRIIKFQKMFFDLDIYSEDTIITLKEAKSFAGQNAGMQYQPEASLDGELIQIVFNCDDEVLAHKVNYQDNDEVEALSAVEGEDEYLVPAETHFIVTYSSNEDDIEDMGYCEVDISQIDSDEYEKLKENGLNEINLI